MKQLHKGYLKAGNLYRISYEKLKIMPESNVTLWDIYLQVKRMKLSNPANFLNMALSHFRIGTLSAFGFSLFYVTCFLWHYPSSSLSIIYAAIKVYKNKIINSLEEWKRRINTYSSQAQRARERFMKHFDECNSSEDIIENTS